MGSFERSPGYDRRLSHGASVCVSCSTVTKPLTNPYSPSHSSVELDADATVSLAAPQAGLFFGSLLLFGVVTGVCYIVYLNIRYPGLIDPPARPVDYWPDLDVFITSVLSSIGAVIGIPVFWYSIVVYRRRICNASEG